ncbi:MAG: hypothetical protein DELT_00642 [Desulfovibrio sp.]
MRILNLDAPFLAQGFTKLGHEVFRAGHDTGADLIVSHPRGALQVYNEVCATGFIPDIAFWCDGSNLPYFPGVEELPCPTAFYSIDTYCHPWHCGFANAFDAVFVAQKDHVPLFPTDSVTVRWLPLFASNLAEEIPWEERDIPVSFVGTRKHPNNPDREGFLQGFRRYAPLMLHTGEFEAVFSRSRIVLNQTACSEVNFRCFEAMACGAALLTEKCQHGMEELFTPGETILPVYTRNDSLQAAAVTKESLSWEEELREIAHNGRRHVAQNHMVQNRAAVVMEVMEELLREGAVRKRAGELRQRKEFIAASYGMLGHDLIGRLDPAYSEYYFSVFSSMKESNAS